MSAYHKLARSLSLINVSTEYLREWQFHRGGYDVGSWSSPESNFEILDLLTSHFLQHCKHLESKIPNLIDVCNIPWLRKVLPSTSPVRQLLLCQRHHSSPDIVCLAVDKCIIITGGNRGIGYAYSRAVAQSGARVAIIYRLAPSRASIVYDYILNFRA
jgi:hypothetical protein